MRYILDQKLINPYIAAASHGKKTKIDGRLLGWIATTSVPKITMHTVWKKKVCCYQIARLESGCWTVLLQCGILVVVQVWAVAMPHSNFLLH